MGLDFCKSRKDLWVGCASCGDAVESATDAVGGPSRCSGFLVGRIVCGVGIDVRMHACAFRVLCLILHDVH